MTAAHLLLEPPLNDPGRLLAMPPTGARPPMMGRATRGPTLDNGQRPWRLGGRALASDTLALLLVRDGQLVREGRDRLAYALFDRVKVDPAGRDVQIWQAIWTGGWDYPTMERLAGSVAAIDRWSAALEQSRTSPPDRREDWPAFRLGLLGSVVGFGRLIVVDAEGCER